MSLTNCLPAHIYFDIARSQGYMYQTSFEFEDMAIWVFVNPKYLKDSTVQTNIRTQDGKHSGSSTGSQDHPSFLATKERLERDGYINTVPWWNGDTVLKPFYFNNVYLDVDDKFKSAAAMGNCGEFAENYNDGEILEGVRNYKNEGEEFW